PEHTLRHFGARRHARASSIAASSSTAFSVPASPRRRAPASLLLVLFLVASAPLIARADAARRVVVIKVDGLSHQMVDRFVRERDPRTGKSRLPWIEHVFYQRGTRVANFYTRGMSLSGPSWSLLDTGQHLQVKGNVEFDRYTRHSYDYLNFIPFWLGHAGGVRVDMPGAEILDEVGTPLLIDAYPYTERHQNFQLYQRGTRWSTLQRSLQNRVTSRSPRELFDEWHTGFESRSILMEQLERELLEKLNDPRIRYLDFYTTDFDHATHHNRDRETHLLALQELDALVGRVWMGIRRTPQAADTALVMVSDHGTNTDERVYSQGYNLVKLLASAAGGGHHVATKRRLLNDYAIKGIYPLVPVVHTTTEDTYYLKGQSTVYPTALVDFDGNERASIHLRNSDLNVLHILLLQLQRRDLAPELRRAAAEAFHSTLD
ncbi:MAG: alkaline phosphatase family protein, partial [Pyrinomonadaceae bacterium]